MGRNDESREMPLDNKINIHLNDDLQKEINGDFNKTNINEMLNSETRLGEVQFLNASTGQAQHNHRTNSLENDSVIGWKPPRKINLDTVDGAVNHNLASNVLDKDTPDKGKIISPNQNRKACSEDQNCFWSEKLKMLSPWSSKSNNNYTKNKTKVCSKSKAFIASSKTKLLQWISPKKDERNRNRKNIFQNFRVQTSVNNNLQPKTKNKKVHGGNSQAVCSHTLQQSQSPSSINTLNRTEETDFDFSRNVRSPNKKMFAASQRKLDFAFNAGTVPPFLPSKDWEKKTYRSFNAELDQDIPISKINYILDNIRSKLETSDHRAAHTFQVTYRSFFLIMAHIC